MTAGRDRFSLQDGAERDREELQEVLAVAADSGQLESCLRQASFGLAPAAQMLARQKAYEALTQACRNGQLDVALACVPSPCPSIPPDLAAPAGKKVVEDLRQAEVVQKRNCAPDPDAVQRVRRKAQAALVASADTVQRARRKAQAALVASARDGGLDAALSETGSCREIKEMVKEALISASMDGRLHEMLGVEAPQTLERQAMAVTAPRTPKSSIVPLRNLRAIALDTMISAKSDGRLEEAFAALQARREGRDADADATATANASAPPFRGGQEIPRTPPGTPEEELEGPEHGGIGSLRTMALETMTASQADGSLEKALLLLESKKLKLASRASTSTKELLRARAQVALSVASRDGRLKAAFKVVEQTQEASGGKAALQTTSSAGNGGHVSALPLSGLDELRELTWQTLATAAEDGRLEGSLSQIKVQSRAPQQQQQNSSPSTKATALQHRALGLLVQSQSDGRLEATLAELQQQRQQRQQKAPAQQEEALRLHSATNKAEAAHCRPVPEAVLAGRSGAGRRSVTELRVKANDVLLAACDSGKLETALASLAAERDGTAAAAKLREQPPGTPLTPRHAELLEKQRGLLHQQRTMQENLRKLQDSNGSIPFLPQRPPASKPPGKRPVGGASMLKAIQGGATFRELRELNATLSAENTRLNTELSRLLARAAQRSSGTS